MAVKHVTIYECDACKAHVTCNAELYKLAIANKEYEVCKKCRDLVNDILRPEQYAQPEEEYDDEQP